MHRHNPNLCAVPTPTPTPQSPGWVPYIAVTDVAERIAKATAAGATVEADAVKLPDGATFARLVRCFDISLLVFLFAPLLKCATARATTTHSAARHHYLRLYCLSRTTALTVRRLTAALQRDPTGAVIGLYSWPGLDALTEADAADVDKEADGSCSAQCRVCCVGVVYP
jgi:hypothetical protein